MVVTAFLLFIKGVAWQLPIQGLLGVSREILPVTCNLQTASNEIWVAPTFGWHQHFQHFLRRLWLFYGKQKVNKCHP
jgi:hypothetical protein